MILRHRRLVWFARPHVSDTAALCVIKLVLDGTDDQQFLILRSLAKRQYFRRDGKVAYTVRISAHADLNLNGSYLVRLELNRDEIAKLFY